LLKLVWVLLTSKPPFLVHLAQRRKHRPFRTFSNHLNRPFYRKRLSRLHYEELRLQEGWEEEGLSKSYSARLSGLVPETFRIGFLVLALLRVKEYRHKPTWPTFSQALGQLGHKLSRWQVKGLLILQ
jgi:hypothetical protein